MSSGVAPRVIPCAPVYFKLLLLQCIAAPVQRAYTALDTCPAVADAQNQRVCLPIASVVGLRP